MGGDCAGNQAVLGLGELTMGTVPGENIEVLGSSASTKVSDRLRMIESNMTMDEVDLSDE